MIVVMGPLDRRRPPLMQRLLSLRNSSMVALIGTGIAVAWGVSWVGGGANIVPPHAFYLPIILAGVRFGVRGAAGTASIAAVVAGPLLPAVVDEGRTQANLDWVVRGLFFLALGVCVAALLRVAVQQEAAAMARRVRERELERALGADELRLHYQPIVRLDGHIEGVEALVRWDHPERGLLTPDQFIGLAEESGLIVPIGRWVLERSCAQYAEWQRAGVLDLDDDFGLSVNVSARQLEDPDFAEVVRSTVDRFGLPPSRLTLEVTETALIDDLDDSVRQLERVKETGVHVAVDDFGVGFGSLTYIHRFPADVLKIDRSFTCALPGSSDVVGGIMLLARTLGMSVIAEGVETLAQADALGAVGVERAQGWLFGRAAPPHVVANHIVAQRQADPTTGPRPPREPSALAPHADPTP